MAKATKTKKAPKRAAKKKKARRVKQSHIAGFEPKRIKEIDDAAAAYCELRNERMRLLEEEVIAKGALLLLMRKHELEQYTIPDSDQEVLRTHGEEGVKVRKRKTEDNGEA